MTRKITAIVVSIIGLGLFSNSYAVDMTGYRNDEWKQKMMSEKIAFLTVEMNITPEEAQVFWPAYNQIWEEKDKAMSEIFRTYGALDQAIKDGKPNKELEKLLDAYLAAQDKQREIDSKSDEIYKEILPIDKVAKLYIGEEKFRRRQILKLHEKKDSKK